MTSISGTNTLLIVADSDALIALLHEGDLKHAEADETARHLDKLGAHLVFPATTIAEVVTTFQRKFNRSDLATAVLDQLTSDGFQVQEIGKEILNQATALFDPYGSKHDTYFDCITAAVAKTLLADAIFSFDSWYRKLGFKLAEDMLHSR